jgi:hypothetical protein
VQIIGTNRREGIDWVQDKLGPMCPRTTAETTFLGLLKEGQIIGCKSAFILAEDMGDDDLRNIATDEVKKRMSEQDKKRRKAPRANNNFAVKRDGSEDDGSLITVQVPNPTPSSQP